MIPTSNRDFFDILEYRLCDAFKHAEQPEIKSLWCDGIGGASLSEMMINGNVMETTAWIGKDGQGKYEAKIILGKRALDQFRNEQELIDCIPSATSTGWFKIDVENLKIEIELL